ncbi:GTPase HflX [Candidatus Babeliales bacterium]|nr:GTPase HflX [Candidatus Babeliales bacterium]MBP9843621.1 GTPase HflX [Candidatus Babeliales bacterium]
MAKNQNATTGNDVKVLLVGVQTPSNHAQNIQAYYEEFLSLATTLGVSEYETLWIKLRSIDNKYFFTQGKLDEIKLAFEKSGATEIIISEQLAGQQERNLQDYLDCRVFDRTRLILSIFEKAAISSEGKLQVEIAQLELLKTRLAGHGIHLEQQAGSIGVKGPGETLKEETTRVLERKTLVAKRQLLQLAKVRETQRKRRLTQRIPQVCLIGYTNAGKSTILNMLTNSDVLAEDKLFATLDTTTRQLFINHKKYGVISDTVGFIQNLPHQLIDAFKSTLSELHYADLLLHVVDLSNVNWKSHMNVVFSTLRELDVEKEMVIVFNKTDLLTQEELEQRINMFDLPIPFVIVNALTKDGLDNLAHYIAARKA